MGRKGLDKADLIRAYLSLRQAGREPSLLNLRLELGRGSYSTIAARLDELCLVDGRGRPLRHQAGRRGRGRPAKLDPERVVDVSAPNPLR
jgi:hypothetical protein